MRVLDNKGLQVALRPSGMREKNFKDSPLEGEDKGGGDPAAGLLVVPEEDVFDRLF